MADFVGTLRSAGNVFRAHSSVKVGRLVHSSGSSQATTFINRVFDSSASGFVRWNSATNPDSAGTTYPGPGVFGVDTSDYCIEGTYT